MLAQHAEVKQKLLTCLSHINLVKAFVGKRDFRGAYGALKRSADVATIAAVLQAVVGMREAFTLDDVPDVAALCEVLLGGTDKQVATGLEVLRVQLKAFGGTIRETCAQAPARMGVDLQFEKRKDRCNIAKLALQGLSMKLGMVQRRADVGTSAHTSEVLAMINDL